MSHVHITTAIPYVNAKPHLGHVLEWFQADALARFARLQGHSVSFTSGADENSLKNVKAAEQVGKDIQSWLDEYSAIFRQAYQQLGISLTGFGRGSDKTHHWPGVQELWRRCVAAGDMYKKTYKGLYCVGCEAFYTTDELVDGKCPEHVVVPEEIEEENYFFRLSKYQQQIEHLIESNTLHIISEQFKQEMVGFVRQGLSDFSVSRSTQRSRGIGVPVPHDTTQVMYVWFDALAIYMTAVGWGVDETQWQHDWADAVERIHIIGKGINRFHSVYWIGMLLSAQLPLPTKISVHGYITVNGQKMSKSLGNVIDPFELIGTYGLEPIRYYLLKYIPTHADGDFSYTKFKDVYTADLANGIGNLCSRVAKLCEKSGVQLDHQPLQCDAEFVRYMQECELDRAIQWVMEQVAQLDKSLALSQPWKKTGDEQIAILQDAVAKVRHLAYHLQPFMPETAAKIVQHFSQEKILSLQPLFPRLG